MEEKIALLRYHKCSKEFYFFVSIFHIFYSVHQGFNHLTTIAVIQFLLLNLKKLTEKRSKYEKYKNHEKFIQIKTV